ncbi:unnamed protein product [Ilex paraguariensis]|uniref:Protein-S-isoprenylcysteine O-methyltransferase n=1 Tax=Ilex paraguariensis TaxID=185542 RepID=A0ABC8V1P9_9AQUA
METGSALLYSKVIPCGFTISNNNRISFRPFNKQLQGQSYVIVPRKTRAPKLAKTPLRCSPSLPSNCNIQYLSPRSLQNPLYSHPLSSSSPIRITSPLFQPIKCSYVDTTNAESQNSLLNNLKSLSFDSVKATLSQLTPIDFCKWSLAISIAVATSKWTLNLLFNPFFWMYFTWTWLFWPWFVALGLAMYGLYCFRKHLIGESNVFEQLAIVTSAFTWLTLVPPAHFNGFLEGWPFVFLFVYHYFFFFNVSVRRRLYGDFYPREHDPKWDINLPSWHRLLFCVGVMVGHWLAAYEGPELHLIPGGWSNVGIWVLIMISLFMQYHSTLYLANYSEKVVVPTAVVQFGPYRWVRHPIYASTMLLFVTYFTALRAPLSALFIIAVCLMYYGQKAKLEEDLMVETFKERYTEYMSKVRYKFIPFVY